MLVDTCGNVNTNSGVDFFNQVFSFYIMMVSEDNIANEELNQFSTALTSLQGSGIRCITGSFKIVFVIVRIAITIYIEISNLIQIILVTTILEITGQCPTGYELGDWNTGEGECCCDPNNQPEEPSGTTGLLPFKLTKTTVGPMGYIPFKIPKSTTSSIGTKWQMPFKIPKSTNSSAGTKGQIPFKLSKSTTSITGPAQELSTVSWYKPAPPKPGKKFCKCRKNQTVTPGKNFNSNNLVKMFRHILLSCMHIS